MVVLAQIEDFNSWRSRLDIYVLWWEKGPSNKTSEHLQNVKIWAFRIGRIKSTLYKRLLD